MAGLPGICMDGHAYILYARYRIMLRDIPIGEENVRRFFVVAMYEGGNIGCGVISKLCHTLGGDRTHDLGFIRPTL